MKYTHTCTTDLSRDIVLDFVDYINHQEPFARAYFGAVRWNLDDHFLFVYYGDDRCCITRFNGKLTSPVEFELTTSFAEMYKDLQYHRQLSAEYPYAYV